ncbi:hypothetical protein ACROYT_G020681 [Oculina patagonica]
MSEFLSVPVELLCQLFNSLTEHFVGHVAVKTTETEENTSMPQLRDDFTDNDPEDTTFEEFESPQNSADPTAWKRKRPSMKISLKKSACYGLFPWFAHQEGFVKVAILALAFLIAILPKVIAQQCVLRLNGVNHPGTSYVLVSTAYTGFNIVYRIMQAEFKSLLAFVALSIGHRLIHLVYEFITILKERYNEKMMYSELDQDLVGGSTVGGSTATPRAQRLAADLTIHDMMSNSAAIVLSVGIIQIYGFIHQNLSVQKYEKIIEELVARIVLALLIEFLFNIVSVMILTRCRNVPVLTVWNLKWKSHLIVCIVSVVMIVIYCTDKLLVIIRARYVAKGKIIPE